MSTCRKLLCLAYGIVVCACLPVVAQRVIATVPAGISPCGMAVNPVTQKLYVANQGLGCGMPTTAQAFVLNATALPFHTLGYLTLWPDGQHQPDVSTLNAADGAVTSNLAIVPNRNGSIDAYASDYTNLILDTFGYFAP